MFRTWPNSDDPLVPGWLTTVMPSVLGNLLVILLLLLGSRVMTLLSRLFALRLRRVESGAGLLTLSEQNL